MPPKSASLHRPLPIDEIHRPDNLATEVTVVITERDTKESVQFICLRATSVDVLYSLLRSYKYSSKIDGKELHFRNNAIRSDANVTLDSLVESSEWIITFYLVAQEGLARVKIEGQDEDESGSVDAASKPDEYAGIEESISQQLETSLIKDLADKPLHVREAVLHETLCLQTALKPLLQKYVLGEPDEAEIRKVHEHAEKLETVARNATTAPIVVGIIGTTGSGKSSLMNAIFGSEVFPVSGTRACTAAITEISYNTGDVAFRATIGMVSAEAWSTEIDLLRQDTETPKDPDSEGEKEETLPADSAWDKLIKVYPFLNRINLHRYSNDDLLKHPTVAPLLGTQIEIQAQTASDFCRQLRLYVDSGETVNGDSNSPSTQMRYWPLVDVARVYLKHWILETGVTIVDIPGGHDHNAARAMSAAKYASKCSAYFMVSNVIRASDDGFAMQMMGEAFRRQLRLDGGVMNDDLVTFVCTQADNVNFSELKETFPEEIEKHMRAYNLEHRKEHEIQKEVSSLEAELAELVRKQDQAEEDLLEAAKKKSKLSRQRKLSPVAVSGVESINRDDCPSPRKRKADELDDSTPEKKQATEKEALASTIAEQDRIVERCSTVIEEYEVRTTKLTQDLEQLRSKHPKVSSSPDLIAIFNAMCIRVRGERAKTAIKTEVVKDVRKIDEQYRPKSKNTEDAHVDYRDYTQVERALPVFVVSSKAFQVLSGYQQDDRDAIRGFLDINDTEIPALQKHCASLTFRARALTCTRTFIHSEQALGSIISWTGHGETREALTPQEMETLRALCKPQYDHFEMALEGLTTNMADDMKRCLTGFSRKLHSAAHAAEKEARDVVAEWHEKGRYQWNTYKAICRRNGSWGKHNWNKSLTKPLEDNLIVPWTRCFTGEHSALAIILRNFLLACCDVLYHRGDQLLRIVRALGSGPCNQLKKQLQLSVDAIMLLEVHALDEITTKAREVNRLATPNIEACMVKVYKDIDKEKGKGSFKRCKDLMVDHVEASKKTIYTSAVQDMNKRLKDVPTLVHDSVWRGLHEIQQRVQNDCNQLMTILTEEQYGLREEIYGTIVEYKQKVHAIRDGHAGTNIFEVNPEASSAGLGSAEANSNGGGSASVDFKVTGEGNASGGDAGGGDEDTGSLFVP